MKSKSEWKKKLSLVKELRGAALTNAWERVTLLVEIYDDPEFRAENPGDDEYLVSILTGHISDLCGVQGETNFRHFHELRKAFPDKARWDKGDFVAMFAEYEASLAATVSPPKANEESQSKRYPTYTELRKSCEALMNRVAELEGIERRLHAKIARLEATIAELQVSELQAA